MEVALHPYLVDYVRERNSNMDTVVCSVVYGDQAPLWETWMVKSLKKVHPDAEYHRVLPNLASMDAVLGTRTPRGYSGYTKSRLWNMFGQSRPSSNPLWKNPARPIWVLDVDLLILRPLRWKPSSDKILMAACRGGDEKYLEFMKKGGVPVQGDITVNCGVLWVRGDLHHLWTKWYDKMCDSLGEATHPVSELTLNAAWHELKAKGEAELLPINYNQIISEHGPHGATIFHLAGTPSHFREQLMKSYYLHHFPEDS